jgi:ATP-dependent DNA ligase
MGAMAIHARAVDTVRDLRPQSFGSRSPNRIVDPVVEPMWSGVRALAGVDDDEAVLHDAKGERLSDHAPIVEQLRAAARGESVILDGFLTKEAVRDGTGVQTGSKPMESTGALIAQSFIGVRRNRAQELADARDRVREATTFGPEEAVSFVVVDLLWLDGEPLLDVPLLERKRLLEGVLGESDLVRRGAFVRPPIATWIGSWRSLGFTGLTFKAPNSRYRPGERNDEWATRGMPRR